MQAHCPDCETELNQADGSCPACGWGPILSVFHIEAQGSEVASNDGYGEFDAGWSIAAAKNAPVFRGRTLTIAALLAMAAVYGVVFTLLSTG
jgi:hypothetical protein